MKNINKQICFTYVLSQEIPLINFPRVYLGIYISYVSEILNFLSFLSYLLIYKISRRSSNN